MRVSSITQLLLQLPILIIIIIMNISPIIIIQRTSSSYAFTTTTTTITRHHKNNAPARRISSSFVLRKSTSQDDAVTSIFGRRRKFLLRTRPSTWLLPSFKTSITPPTTTTTRRYPSVLFSVTSSSSTTNNNNNENDKTSSSSSSSTVSVNGKEPVSGNSNNNNNNNNNNSNIANGVSHFSTRGTNSTGGVAFPHLSLSSTTRSYNTQQQSDNNTTTTDSTNSTATSTGSTDDASNNNNNNDNNNGGNAFDANSVLAIDPKIIKIVTVADEEQRTMDQLAQSLTTMSNSTITTTGPLPTTTTASNDYKTKNAATAMDLFLSRLPFVEMFRGSANYIANHRNTVAVYHIPGGLVEANRDGGNCENNNTVFRDLMNDVALTWLLGMRIVIVAGCRHQIEKRIGSTSTSGGQRNDHGLRVTDEATLRVVKEEAGYVRFEVERQLARSLRMQGTSSFVPGGGGGTGGAGGGAGGNGKTEMINGGTGTMNGENTITPASVAGGSIIGGGALLPRMPFHDGNVVSGNFYFAQPFGILDGVDYKYSGFVRRVEVEKIRRLHDSRDICLLTSLGVSPSGEVFNVNSESLAATVAGALGASKVIYFTEQEIELRHAIHNNKIHSLRIFDARNLLKYHNIQIHRKGYITTKNIKPPSVDADDADSDDDDEESATTSSSTAAATASTITTTNNSSNDNIVTENEFDMLSKVGWCTEAIALGVKRAHIISPKHGALLQELYTRDGSGTLICADLYEGIRRADCTDVAGIHELISPLIRKGTLIDRPKAQLEKDIDTYYVYTRDTSIVACGQLKKFEDGYAEIGCLVVNKEFRSRGRGDAMLGYLERLCLLNSCNKIFVLSTQTMEWFIERGFKVADVPDLPPSRQATYNYQRKSKIYLKIIENDRDLDASELWWNR